MRREGERGIRERKMSKEVAEKKEKEMTDEGRQVKE